jgi:hypothetical protein
MIERPLLAFHVPAKADMGGVTSPPVSQPVRDRAAKENPITATRAITPSVFCTFFMKTLLWSDYYDTDFAEIGNKKFV